MLQVSTKDWILQYAEQDSPSDSDTAPDDSSSTEYDPVSCLLQKTVAVTVYIIIYAHQQELLGVDIPIIFWDNCKSDSALMK